MSNATQGGGGQSAYRSSIANLTGQNSATGIEPVVEVTYTSAEEGAGNEVITSKYMGYGMKICHIKIGKIRKIYPNKSITQTVLDIFERDEIYGAYYLYYPPNMKAKPHVDYNPFKKNYLRIQIPVKIPNNNENNECYIEWIQTKEIVY